MDESLVVHRLLGDAPGQVMVDAGAHYGTTLASFAETGWEIHAFEPDPVNREQLLAAVRSRPNVRVVGKGLADRPGRLTLYRSNESSGISAFHPFTSGHRPAGTVDVTTLNVYLSDREIERVDFLKIDVEGYERSVLEGFPWDKCRPRAILLEFEDAKTVPLGYGWTDLAEVLRSRGYRILVSEWCPVEAYGSAHRWRRFAIFPVKLAEATAWGNLLAVLPQDFRRLHRLAAMARWRLRLRELLATTASRRG